MASWTVDKLTLREPVGPANYRFDAILRDKDSGNLKVETDLPAMGMSGVTAEDFFCELEDRGYTPNDFNVTCV